MKKYENETFSSERALYGEKNVLLKACSFLGKEDGESALKETENVEIVNTEFALRYPLWHAQGAKIIDSVMAETCRAPMWYDKNVELNRVSILGVKALRESENIEITESVVSSEEFCWKCNSVKLVNSKIGGVYSFFMSNNLSLDNIVFDGKYSFQYVNNAVIHNCVLDTKDAFWHSENVTVYDSEVRGEYLGWYSKNLKLVRCKIIGTQPLCYAENLELENCTMENCDLSFENSSVNATVLGVIDSVKNPLSGTITADRIGGIIIDGFSRGMCKIIDKSK